MPAWQQLTGKDAHSLFGEPNFKNPDGDTSNVDLHINFPSPVNSIGTPASTTITDFHGDIRTGLTPVDIGADAGGGITPPTSLQDLGIPGFSASVYPNPTSDKSSLFIESPLYLNLTISLYDNNGQRLFYNKQAIFQGRNLVPIHSLKFLPAGSYILTIDTGKKRAGMLIIKRK